MLLRVAITSKATAKVKVRVKISHACAEGQIPNVVIPQSELCDVIYRAGDAKVLVHLYKTVPWLPWTPL